MKWFEPMGLASMIVEALYILLYAYVMSSSTSTVGAPRASVQQPIDKPSSISSRYCGVGRRNERSMRSSRFLCTWQWQNFGAMRRCWPRTCNPGYER
jgi:hypothetical protein